MPAINVLTATTIPFLTFIIFYLNIFIIIKNKKQNL